MAEASVTFGALVRRYETVASTQNVARDLALAGAAAPGTVVAARFQTQGRGRRGRIWHAPPGANVCLTAIGPPVDASIAWQIALVAGLAACEAVRKIASGVDARVRFPNDVTIGGRKVSGVLVETMLAPTAFPFPASGKGVLGTRSAAGSPTAEVKAATGLVPSTPFPLAGKGKAVGATTAVPLIGIGINVQAAPLPPEVAAIATSLEAAAPGRPFDVAAVETVLLRQLTLAWDEWTWNGFAVTLARWKSLSDPDARRTFVLDGRPVRCRVCDLAENGTLTLETDAGDLRELLASAVILGDD